MAQQGNNIIVYNKVRIFLGITLVLPWFVMCRSVSHLCTLFEEEKPSSLFRQYTLVDLYQHPDLFMNTKGANKCGLKYIDLFKIQPATGKQNLFIIFLGDSVLKELWVAASQRFTGYIPDDRTEVQMSIKGSHFGPVDFEDMKEVPKLDMKGSFPTVEQGHGSHDQYLVCCRAVYHGDEDDGDCILAKRRTLDMDLETQSKHRLFLFDDMYSYIREFVASLFVDNFKCLAYMKAVDWLEADRLATGFINNQGYKGIELYPHAVITNIGMHSFHKPASDTQKEFEKFLRTVNRGDAPIRYIMHSTTAVHEGNCGLANCKNKEIISYNALIKSLSSKWNRLEAYLDFFNYSSSLIGLNGFARTCDAARLSAKACKCQNFDGIHFERICNYGPLLTQWDFNWLLSLSVFNVPT